MSAESIPPTKISDETFYWLIRYEAERGGNVDTKTISKLLDIKNNAAYMQISRAKKRLETAGVTFEMKDGGDGEVAEKGKGGGAGKKRAASVEEEGLDGMMNPKKKAKGKKVKVEEAEEDE